MPLLAATATPVATLRKCRRSKAHLLRSVQAIDVRHKAILPYRKSFKQPELNKGNCHAEVSRHYVNPVAGNLRLESGR